MAKTEPRYKESELVKIKGLAGKHKVLYRIMLSVPEIDDEHEFKVRDAPIYKFRGDKGALLLRL